MPTLEKAGEMGRRINREQKMFETTKDALGGSTTANNLADAADTATTFGNQRFYISFVPFQAILSTSAQRQVSFVSDAEGFDV